MFAVAFGVGINVNFTGPTRPDYFPVILSVDKRTVKDFIAAVDGTTHLVDTDRSVAVSNGGKSLSVSGYDQCGMLVTAVVNC